MSKLLTGTVCVSVFLCARMNMRMYVWFTYDQDVVELLYSVYLGEQLVDHRVVDTCAACHAATLLTDGVDLVKDDDVQPTVGAQLWKKRDMGE